MGGNQYLASFWTVYNQMMSDCPEVLEVLAGDFPWPEILCVSASLALLFRCSDIFLQ